MSRHCTGSLTPGPCCGARVANSVVKHLLRVGAAHARPSRRRACTSRWPKVPCTWKPQVPAACAPWSSRRRVAL
eukprot:1619922-Pyramimonas_sp.AAC.1